MWRRIIHVGELNGERLWGIFGCLFFFSLTFGVSPPTPLNSGEKEMSGNVGNEPLVGRHEWQGIRIRFSHKESDRALQ